MTENTAVQPFRFEHHELRWVIWRDDPWVILADACRALEHSNPSVAARLVDAQDLLTVKKSDIPTLKWTSPNPNVQMINESGFYTLAFASRAPGAQRMRRWVTSEVLPAIRKTGAYITPAATALDPLDALQAMITQMRVQRDQLAVHDRAILELGARTERLEAGYERLAATGFANLRGLRHDVAYLNRLGRVAAAIARRDRVPIEKAHSTIFGTVNAWPVEVWDEALNHLARVDSA